MPNEFTSVAATADLKPGQMARFRVRDTWVLVVNLDGEYFAIADTCTHEDASLYKGVLTGNCIRCPLHGSRFDIRTGRPLEEPAEEPLAVYTVRIEEDRIHVGSPIPNKV